MVQSSTRIYGTNAHAHVRVMYKNNCASELIQARFIIIIYYRESEI